MRSRTTLYMEKKLKKELKSIHKDKSLCNESFNTFLLCCIIAGVKALYKIDLNKIKEV